MRATGLEALALATKLLQRARLADPVAGLWEAADVQWAWRAPRRSDEVEKLFWVDDEGPVAGVLLTSWSDAWQCDPITVPHANAPDPETVWNAAFEHAAEHASKVDVPVDDEDQIYLDLARRAGLTVGHRDKTAWLDAADWQDRSDRPGLSGGAETSALPAGGALAEGFALSDRSQRLSDPHQMRQRNGVDVAQRLEQCSLYDPALDLAVMSADGRVAGYSLYWFDPVTKVGLVEPVRVEDDFQRRGLARKMLTNGIGRLIARGARRVKVSYETEAAGALYQGLGFLTTSTTTWYRA